MKSEIYRCDVCKVEKKESNHWFKAWRRDEPPKPNAFVLYHWQDPAATTCDIHLCSLPCATKAMCAAMEQTQPALKIFRTQGPR
jgi:hypothetical protein